MKKRSINLIFICLFFCALANSKAASSIVFRPFHEQADSLPNSDSLIIKLKAIPLASYEGHTVDSLLRNLPPGVIKQAFATGPGKEASVFYASYGHDVVVVVYVMGFAHMDPHIVNTPTPTQNWNVDLFKLETLRFAVIYNGVTCINGCDKAFRYSGMITPDTNGLVAFNKK